MATYGTSKAGVKYDVDVNREYWKKHIKPKGISYEVGKIYLPGDPLPIVAKKGYKLVDGKQVLDPKYQGPSRKTPEGIAERKEKEAARAARPAITGGVERDPTKPLYRATGEIEPATETAQARQQEAIQLQSPEERARIEQENREYEEREAYGTKLATGIAITTGGMVVGAALGALVGLASVGGATVALTKAAKVGASTKFPALGMKITSRVAVNTKTLGLTGKIISKVFSPKAMAAYGGWAGSVFLGKWAQAEAAEPITIPLRDALKQAKETGDWSIYNEYKEAADEITDMSIWEQILSWSPIAAIPGILKKIKGVKEGVKLIDAIAKKEQEREDTGETEEQKWADIYAEQEERTLKSRQETEEYYAGVEEKRKETKEQEREEGEEYWEGISEEKKKAKKEEREADEAYWDRIAGEKRETELEERTEDEKYWARIRAKEKDRKAAERKTDEAYWAAIYAANEKRKEGEKPATEPEMEEIKEEETGEPLTPEEKEVISDWNAGKSALNFKWLGR